MGDKFQDKIIQSDIDEDIVYKENKKERYSLILDKMKEEKTPSSDPSISLTPQSYVNKNSLPDDQTSVIEYIDEKADLSRHDAGSTAGNLEKLKYFWNSSIGLIANFILDNFQNSYLDDESNIMPKKDGKQMGIITKRDIIAADAEETNEVGNAVRPLINIDGETYDRVRNQDYDLKKDSKGKYIPRSYGLADKSRDLFNLPIEDSSNLTYTRKKEENPDNNYGTRLIMPKNVRRVEIEDLNRNFWVIAQSIMTIGNYIFEDGPFSQIIQAFSAEIIQLWENTLYLWIRIYYEHNRAAKDNIILTLPVPADGVLTSNKYNGYYVIPDSDSCELTIDGESLPEEDEIKVIIINRLSYLIDKYPQSNICVIPYIRLNNYKHNYFTSIYYPGIYFYLRKQNRAYFKFFKKNTGDRFIIKYDDYCCMLAAISQDQNEYLYPASLTEFYLEDKATPFYAGIRPQITEGARIEITNDGYILKDFSLQLWDMVDSANRKKWNSTSCLVTFETQDINLLDEGTGILLSPSDINEGRKKRGKSRYISQTYGAEYPYYLGEIPSKRRKTSKDGDYRVNEKVKPQIDKPEKVIGGFTAPLFLFNEDFKDIITINKKENDIDFDIKVSELDSSENEPLYCIECKETYHGMPKTNCKSIYTDWSMIPTDLGKTFNNSYTPGESDTATRKQAQAGSSKQQEYGLKDYVKPLQFNEYVQKAGLTGESYKYWSKDNSKEHAVKYLIDNYSKQETITSGDGDYIPFTKKKKDNSALNYYNNLQWNRTQQAYGDLHTASGKLISGPPDRSSSDDYGYFLNDSRAQYLISKDQQQQIYNAFQNTIKAYDENSLTANFPLRFYYNYFFSKQLVQYFTECNWNVTNERELSYGGSDPRGYRFYSTLAFIARYTDSSGINFQTKLPYYWQYIFDNNTNKMSIYDLKQTIFDLAKKDLTIKAIVNKNENYKNVFNTLKIHPFFTFSKAGISFTKNAEGYKGKLKKEYLNKLTFFIEKDYLKPYQTEGLLAISDENNNVIGYSIEWNDLNIDIESMTYENIEFDQPQFFKYYETTRLSSQESWYQTFFKSLTPRDKYPDSLNDYLSDNYETVPHYYISKTKNETWQHIEQILNDNNSADPKILTEDEFKDDILSVLKRKTGSRLEFPFTYGNKKYNLTLITEKQGQEMITQSYISII